MFSGVLGTLGGESLGLGELLEQFGALHERNDFLGLLRQLDHLGDAAVSLGGLSCRA